MGVGVYESNFHGTGETFIISPSYSLTEAGYDAYVAEYAKDHDEGDEPLDMETWEQEESDDWYDFMSERIDDTLKAIDVGFWSQNDRRRFPADSDFILLSRNDRVAVCTMSWEHDYIIGIGPANDEISELITGDEEYEGACLENWGVSQDDFRKRHEDAVSALSKLLIQTLSADGFDVRYRSGDYTSKQYAADSEFDPEAVMTVIRGVGPADTASFR